MVRTARCLGDGKSPVLRRSSLAPPSRCLTAPPTLVASTNSTTAPTLLGPGDYHRTIRIPTPLLIPRIADALRFPHLIVRLGCPPLVAWPVPAAGVSTASAAGTGVCS